MAIESEPRARPKANGRASKNYGSENVDQLPYGSDEKAGRYATEHFLGATGLNWYTCDPTLQRAMRYYLCLLYTSPSPRDRQKSRMPSSA